jgi:hypothetical protein
VVGVAERFEHHVLAGEDNRVNGRHRLILDTRPP